MGLHVPLDLFLGVWAVDEQNPLIQFNPYRLVGIWKCIVLLLNVCFIAVRW